MACPKYLAINIRSRSHHIKRTFY